MPIWISSRFRAADLAERHNAHKVISLLAPGDEFPSVTGFDDDRHLKLEVDDIPEHEEGLTPPAEEHVRAIIEFVEGWDRENPMLVHCWAGISRSTATAFTIACLFNPRADEYEIAKAIRQASDTAQPNRLIVKHADRLLGRRGRMVEAVRAMGSSVPAYEALPFRIPSTYETPGLG